MDWMRGEAMSKHATGSPERAPSTAIKGLGEVALRVKNIELMHNFYENVVNLELLKRFPKSAFFRIAEGVGGHTQVFVLFERPLTGGTTLDHVAFSILLEDFESEKRRVEDLGIPIVTDEHDWVHWRSFYIDDPEGNKVEWVCFDPDV